MAVTQLQMLTEQRSSPSCIQHAHTHQNLPGIISEGKALVDQAVSALMLSPPAQARELHACFFNSAASLHKLNSLASI